MARANATPTDLGLHCPCCGYNLTGAPSNRCPECGGGIEPSDLIDPLHWTAGKRAAGVVACGVCAAASLIGLALLTRGRTRLLLWDGLEVVAVGVASVGHVGLAALVIAHGSRRPSSSAEAARLIRFCGAVSVILGVIAAFPMLEPRVVRGVEVSSLLEFALTSALFVMPGAALLLLHALMVVTRGSRSMDGGPSRHPFGGDALPFVVDALGRFPPDRVDAVQVSASPPPSLEIMSAISRHWEAELALAKEENRVLFDGALLALRRCESRAGRLRLSLGPTSYKEFLATNLDRASGRSLEPDAFRSDALGVSALPATSDGFLVLGRRGRSVAFHAGWTHLVGGMAEPGDVREDGSIDLFAAAVRELVEELLVRPGEIEEVCATAVVRDRSILQPELIFDMTMSASRAELERRFAAGPTDGEHDALVFVGDDPETIAHLLTSGTKLTPIAQAALLLRGLRNWGSAWFERQCLSVYGDLPSLPSESGGAA